MIAKAIQATLRATVYGKPDTEYSGVVRPWYRKMLKVLPKPLRCWVDEVRVDLDWWSYDKVKEGK